MAACIARSYFQHSSRTKPTPEVIALPTIPIIPTQISRPTIRRHFRSLSSKTHFQKKKKNHLINTEQTSNDQQANPRHRRHRSPRVRGSKSARRSPRALHRPCAVPQSGLGDSAPDLQSIPAGRVLQGLLHGLCRGREGTRGLLRRLREHGRYVPTHSVNLEPTRRANPSDNNRKASPSTSPTSSGPASASSKSQTQSPRCATTSTAPSTTTCN